MAMGGAFEHFRDSMENLRAAKTEGAAVLIAEFESDYILLKTKLRKEVNKEEVIRAVKISEEVSRSCPHVCIDKIFSDPINFKIFQKTMQ